MNHDVPILGVEVIRRIPHDATASTQGFATSGSRLYEGTGQYGLSTLRELDLTTGELLRVRPLRDDLFGEGIAVVGDTIWQLTWREHTVLEWDRPTMTLRREVPVPGDGWGLCFDGDRLVHSDGTDMLRFRDPVTLAETGAITVRWDGEPLPYLNDLTFCSGRLWANVLTAGHLVGIDPGTGEVTAVADASELLTPDQRASAGPLNGITATGPGRVLLSGKRWPFAFEARLRERSGWSSTDRERIAHALRPTLLVLDR